MRARTTLSALVFFLAAGGPGGPGGAAPPDVAYTVPDPATVTYVSGDTARMDIEIVGQSLQARVTTSGTYRAAFAGAPDGVRVTLTVEDFSGRITRALGGSQTADESAIDGPLVFTLDRRGHASLLSEPEVAEPAQQFMQPLGVAHSFFPRVPGRAVTPGYSWQDTIRFDGPTGGGEVNSVSMMTYTVRGDTVVDGRSLLHVVAEGTTEQASTGAVAGQSFSRSVRGDVEGFYFWDVQRGVMSMSFLDTDARGQMTVAAAPFPLTIRVRSQSRTRLADM